MMEHYTHHEQNKRKMTNPWSLNEVPLDFKGMADQNQLELAPKQVTALQQQLSFSENNHKSLSQRASHYNHRLGHLIIREFKCKASFENVTKVLCTLPYLLPPSSLPGQLGRAENNSTRVTDKIPCLIPQAPAKKRPFTLVFSGITQFILTSKSHHQCKLMVLYSNWNGNLEKGRHPKRVGMSSFFKPSSISMPMHQCIFLAHCLVTLY